MMARLRWLLLASMMIAAVGMTMAQDRKVTPVEVDDEKPQAPVLHYYDRHGNPLDEPVLLLADIDTVKNVSAKPVYPLLNSVSFGANFFDAIMKIAGQSYASFDIWAALSLHNWFSPVVELGIGYGSKKPENNNYNYTAKPSFYGKVGVNYNFLYKSNPDYQVFLGLRAGFTSFSYDIKDITINSGYWDQSNTFNLPTQHAFSIYGEALAGIQVKLIDRISMGWTFRYHFKMHTKKGDQSDPWFIPGYGAKSPITATLSVIYTLPLSKGKIADSKVKEDN